ncbi:hypothetical protein [uncultured Sphingomonas sp.]|uniref:hypothetical protein n=1 Tax=uncultured Sphingomonas sp. TaxID=158754 RepID=UPI0035CA372E
MKLTIGLATALLATNSALAQSTDCLTFGNQTSCTTTGSQPSATAQAQASMDRQAAEAAATERAAEDRKAIMFNQVGGLIAKGDCDGAKRLANFYSDRALTKATLRACP